MEKKRSIRLFILALMMIVLIMVGRNKYIASTTQFVYGKLPDEVVLERYEKVEYTIPVIDEDGRRGTQTFKINSEGKKEQFVKLHVRNNKVKKYEFINEEQLPSSVKNNM